MKGTARCAARAIDQQLAKGIGPLEANQANVARFVDVFSNEIFQSREAIVSRSFLRVVVRNCMLFLRLRDGDLHLNAELRNPLS